MIDSKNVFSKAQTFFTADDNAKLMNFCELSAAFLSEELIKDEYSSLEPVVFAAAADAVCLYLKSEKDDCVVKFKSGDVSAEKDINAQLKNFESIKNESFKRTAVYMKNSFEIKTV